MTGDSLDRGFHRAVGSLLLAAAGLAMSLLLFHREIDAIVRLAGFNVPGLAVPAGIAATAAAGLIAGTAMLRLARKRTPDL